MDQLVNRGRRIQRVGQTEPTCHPALFSAVAWLNILPAGRRRCARRARQQI
jgi:hypothetical protein